MALVNAMSATPTEEQADVVVVGGGPGGSTLATLVAMRGHQVVLLEKEKFPRWQIGESLLPSTVHGVCRLTGVADELAKAGFTKKRGGTQRWGANPAPWTFAFSVSPKMAGETSFAYQVERSKFDQILLDHARHMGVDVREQHAVSDVLIEQDRVRGVSYTDADGNAGTIRAKYVVDASGNKSRIYQRSGATRQYSEFFRSLALFGYYEGGKRLPEPNSGNILSCAFDSGWFWYIPLTPTLTSVGAVVRRELASKIQGDPEEALRALIAECPMISDYLRDAKRVTEGQYGELRVRRDYSYANTKFWRPGMVLIGDAACFVDPIFSSGVHLATYGALLAARSINSVLTEAVDEETAFREFEQRYRREFGVYYEFLVAFYDLNVNEDSYFWSAKKVTKNTSSELQSFVELVGGVSGEAALPATGSADHYKRRSSEFSGAVDELVANKEQSMVPIIRSSIVKSAMQEGAREQARVLLGADAAPDTPLFDGGLVPSPDGLAWSMPA
jgi:FAD-dependent halogenase